jgi:hypothetical protein
MSMKYRGLASALLLLLGHLLLGHPPGAFSEDAVPRDAAGVEGPKDAPAVEQKSAVKWYQLQNVTIPPDCSLRSQENITKPPAIFVEIKKNGKRIFQSSTEKGWSVDYPKNKHVFQVDDDPDAIYTIQVWDDCWWNQNICNITGLSPDAFEETIYQKGGQYDTKERLLSVQFKEVQSP